MIAINFCVVLLFFQAKALGKGLASKGSFEIDVYMVCFEGYFSFSPLKFSLTQYIFQLFN
jgi:hypothetical protein